VALEPIVKPEIAALVPYEPGKPVEELERELGIEGAIKLASNENPLGPSPRALEAARRALSGMHRYPDGGSFGLRRRLASHLGVEPGQIVLGTGADEILELLVKAFVRPGDEVVYAWPSFAMYPIVVQWAGAQSVRVALDAGMVHDLKKILAAVTPRTRLLFICNPNNPTGTSVGASELDAFVEALPPHVVLAIDEAYCEFARRPDFPRTIEWISRRPGTIVLRTFSKIYGLAGLRVGYGAGDAELVGYLERARHPFNINSVAQAAAEAALDDLDHVAATQRVNAQGVEYLTRELRTLGIEVWPTDANFLLARAGGRATYEGLLRAGVIVRPLEGFGLGEHVRISIGLPEENERLVKALRRLRQEAA
jgi:histidinol-phosphate aminotransferase